MDRYAGKYFVFTHYNNFIPHFKTPFKWVIHIYLSLKLHQYHFKTYHYNKNHFVHFQTPLKCVI